MPPKGTQRLSGAYAPVEPRPPVQCGPLPAVDRQPGRPPGATLWVAWLRSPGALALLAGAALWGYLGLVVDPSVLYEHGGAFPAFQYGTEFWRPFSSQPGGPCRYAAAFLAQSCACRWLGAGVLALLALVLGWGFGWYVRDAAGRRALPWATLAMLAALLVWSRYGLHLGSLVALALVLLGAAAYAHPRAGSLRPWLRTALALGGFVLGYGCCGGVVYVAVLLGAAVEYRTRAQARLAAVLLLAGFAIPVAI